jgi:hypothetical protein
VIAQPDSGLKTLKLQHLFPFPYIMLQMKNDSPFLGFILPTGVAPAAFNFRFYVGGLTAVSSSSSLSSSLALAIASAWMIGTFTSWRGSAFSARRAWRTCCQLKLPLAS